jgi:hypothetical protein
MTKKQGSVFFGHSDFVIPSSLGIRHCLSYSRLARRTLGEGG